MFLVRASQMLKTFALLHDSERPFEAGIRTIKRPGKRAGGAGGKLTALHARRNWRQAPDERRAGRSSSGLLTELASLQLRV